MPQFGYLCSSGKGGQHVESGTNFGRKIYTIRKKQMEVTEIVKSKVTVRVEERINESDVRSIKLTRFKTQKEE